MLCFHRSHCQKLNPSLYTIYLQTVPYSKRILSQNKLSPSFANTFVPLRCIICTQPFHWHIVGSHWFHGSASLCNETFHPLKVVQTFCLEPGKLSDFWQLRQSNFTVVLVMPSLWIFWLSEDWSLLNWSSVGHRQNSTGQGPEQLNITLTLALLLTGNMTTWFSEVLSSRTVLWLCRMSQTLW